MGRLHVVNQKILPPCCPQLSNDSCSVVRVKLAFLRWPQALCGQDPCVSDLVWPRVASCGTPSHHLSRSSHRGLLPYSCTGHTHISLRTFVAADNLCLESSHPKSCFLHLFLLFFPFQTDTIGEKIMNLSSIHHPDPKIINS